MTYYNNYCVFKLSNLHIDLEPIKADKTNLLLKCGDNCGCRSLILRRMFVLGLVTWIQLSNVFFFTWTLFSHYSRWASSESCTLRCHSERITCLRSGRSWTQNQCALVELPAVTHSLSMAELTLFHSGTGDGVESLNSLRITYLTLSMNP